MGIRIDIEHVRKIQEERKRINSIPLEQIEWYEDGIKLEIHPDLIREFLFTGLDNTDFIISEMYKDKGPYRVFKDSECGRLFDEKQIVGQKMCYLGDVGCGSTGIGPRPIFVDAEEFVKRVSTLRSEGMTKEQCKEFVFKKLEKKGCGYNFSGSWIEWDSLIEAVFGNLETDNTNPVVRNVIEIMKRDKSL